MVCDPQCSAITIRQVDCSDVWHPERLVSMNYFNNELDSTKVWPNDSEENLNIYDAPPDYKAPDDDW